MEDAYEYHAVLMREPDAFSRLPYGVTAGCIGTIAAYKPMYIAD
jgi:hypothetical protein